MDPNMQAGYAQPIAPEVRPPRGWWRRNWLWFVPSVLLGSFLVCGGCCAGLFFLVFSVIRTSEPYQMALQQVQQNPQVIERLGEPVTDVAWPPPMGEVDWKGPQGEANLTFSVRGPKGEAEVLVQARRVAGQWGMISLNLVFDDGSRLSLGVKSERAKKGSLEDAPAWKP